ncbi:MAG: tRNA(Ile)-lysidine synthetase, partial [Bacteroidetes bacterium]
KIPAHEKENIYVVEDEKNIIWVVGQRISELYKTSPETEKVLKLQVSWF